jgi:hypothetical protein
MHITKVLRLPEAQQLHHLGSRVVDYRVLTDGLCAGEKRLPWVTATITAINFKQQSIFIQGRWLFRRNVEIRAHHGRRLVRIRRAPIASRRVRDYEDADAAAFESTMRRFVTP